MWVEKHARDTWQAFEKHAFPTMGRLPIRDITPPMVLKLLRVIEFGSGADRAKRVRQHMSGVFVQAIATGQGEQDPANVVTKAMAHAQPEKRPAVTTIEEARAVLAGVEARAARPLTKLLRRFLALTSVCPGEARQARWEEFEDLLGETLLWRIPKGQMKMKRERLGPVSS